MFPQRGARTRCRCVIRDPLAEGRCVNVPLRSEGLHDSPGESDQMAIGFAWNVGVFAVLVRIAFLRFERKVILS